MTFGAKVNWATISENEGINGVDDLITLRGEEYVLQLIENAEPFDDEAKKNRKTQSSILVGLVGDIDLFRTTEGEDYATIPVKNHFETWALKSRGFRDWLSRKFYESQCSIPSAQGLQDTLNVLSGKARFEGETKEVHTRIAEQDEYIFVDLCDEDWRVVRIDKIGWQIVRDSPVKFRRTKGMKPLPEPTRGGSLEPLRSLINVRIEEWRLFLACLIAAFRPSRPFPALAIYGEQGSAKSTVSRMFRELIDPNTASLRSQPRDDRDLMIAAKNGWMIAFDNLSSIPVWLSDALCRLSTGGGLSTRTLYENDEETLFDAMRPIIINGIEELATRSDLLDRTVSINLPTIPPDKRRTEKEIWEEFNAIRPSVLGTLLTAVSQALREVDNVHFESLPRMADFALWACAAETALGLEEGEFMEAYTQNREGANEMALEASLIAPVVIAFAQRETRWTGIARDLLKELNELADEDTQKQKGYPKRGNFLSGMLKRIAPNLRAAGVEITLGNRSGKQGAKHITLEWTGNSSSASSASSANK